MNDPCGKAWDRFTRQYGLATEGEGNADAYCRARRLLEHCVVEHGDSFADWADDAAEQPFRCGNRGERWER